MSDDLAKAAISKVLVVDRILNGIGNLLYLAVAVPLKLRRTPQLILELVEPVPTWIVTQANLVIVGICVRMEFALFVMLIGMKVTFRVSNTLAFATVVISALRSNT